MRRVRLLLLLRLFVIATIAQAGVAGAQPPPSSLTQEIRGQRVDERAAVTFFNRPIAVLRARVAGRSPSERALGAERLLRDLDAQGVDGPVEVRSFESAAMIVVGSRGVLMLTSADIDDLAGETLDGVTARTVAELREALFEAAEVRRPRDLLIAALLSLIAIAVAVALLTFLARMHSRISAAFVAATERKIAASGLASIETVKASHLLDAQRYFATALITTADLVVVYAVVAFVLRRFPFTRAWGESMGGFLISTVETLALSGAGAVPGLVTVAIILALARVVTRLTDAWFTAIERGQTRITWLHPDTAQPTRRLVNLLIWIFSIIVAYPYMPGSQSEAFKGISVFLGLMVTFGSSGLLNHIMSGFMITYSRAVCVGDYVRISDIEGTVMKVGVLSTKMMTPWREEVTIPNAVVVAATITDYSRFGGQGVFTPTSVTIGYDTPWRQVHALLLTAAERTSGLRTEPKPTVVQASLEDFYVKYTLLVCLERQEERPFVLDVLHANIQDAFNEHGVQIMSPNYMLDPAAPKIVPKERWFTSPADVTSTSRAPASSSP